MCHVRKSSQELEKSKEQYQEYKDHCSVILSYNVPSNPKVLPPPYLPTSLPKKEHAPESGQTTDTAHFPNSTWERWTNAQQ